MRGPTLSLPVVLLFAISISPAWAQVCDPNFPPCDTTGSPSSGGPALSFGAESLTLLANRKRERDAERGEQASRGLLLVSADAGLAGIVADATAAKWAFWGSGLHTEAEGTSPDLRYRAKVSALLAGAELIAPEGHAAGLAVGYDRATGDLRFEDAQQRGDETLAILYGAYLLGPSTSVDAAVSYARSDVSRRVRSPSFDLFGGYTGHRSSVSINLGHFMEAGPVFVTAHAGYLATNDRHPQYEESGTDGSAIFGTTVLARSLNLSQLNAALETAYPLWQQGELFGALSYRYDLHRSADDLIARGAHGDDDEFELEFGARHRFTDSLTLSASAALGVERRGYRGETGQLTLRWEP